MTLYLMIALTILLGASLGACITLAYYTWQDSKAWNAWEVSSKKSGGTYIILQEKTEAGDEM